MSSLKKIVLYSFYTFVMMNLLFMPAIANANSVSECVEEGLNCDEDNAVGSIGNGGEVSESSRSGSVFLDIVKLFFALALVLGLIYFLLKLLNKRNKTASSIKTLENLGGVSVGQGKSVQIIRLGNAFFLIGVGDNVGLLKEITEGEIIEELSSSVHSSSDFPGSSFLNGILPKQDVSNKGKESNGFKSLFSKELDNLKDNRNRLINRHKEDNR